MSIQTNFSYNASVRTQSHTPNPHIHDTMYAHTDTSTYGTALRLGLGRSSPQSAPPIINAYAPRVNCVVVGAYLKVTLGSRRGGSLGAPTRLTPGGGGRDIGVAMTPGQSQLDWAD